MEGIWEKEVVNETKILAQIFIEFLLIYFSFHFRERHGSSHLNFFWFSRRSRGLDIEWNPPAEPCPTGNELVT